MSGKVFANSRAITRSHSAVTNPGERAKAFDLIAGVSCNLGEPAGALPESTRSLRIIRWEREGSIRRGRKRRDGDSSWNRIDKTRSQWRSRFAMRRHRERFHATSINYARSPPPQGITGPAIHLSRENKVIATPGMTHSSARWNLSLSLSMHGEKCCIKSKTHFTRPEWFTKIGVLI